LPQSDQLAKCGVILDLLGLELNKVLSSDTPSLIWGVSVDALQ